MNNDEADGAADGAMDAGANAPTDPAPPTGRVTFDAPCRRCGYNLRTLPLDAVCPECATPVGLSTRGDLLRFSEPRWVAGLARGIRLVLWGFLALVVTSVLGGCVGYLSMRIAGATVLGTWGLITVPGSVMVWLGTWLLTTPDPNGTGEDRYGTARKTVRAVMALSIASTVLTMFGNSAALSPTAAQALGWVLEGVGLVTSLGLIVELHYLGRLAERIPNDWLFRRARFLGWTLGGGMAVMGVVVTIQTRMVPGAIPPRPTAAWVAGIGAFLVIGVVLFVLGILYLLFLMRLGKSFREQALIARQTWAPHDPPPAAGPSAD